MARSAAIETDHHASLQASFISELALLPEKKSFIDVLVAVIILEVATFRCPWIGGSTIIITIAGTFGEAVAISVGSAGNLSRVVSHSDSSAPESWNLKTTGLQNAKLKKAEKETIDAWCHFTLLLGVSLTNNRTTRPKLHTDGRERKLSQAQSVQNPLSHSIPSGH